MSCVADGIMVGVYVPAFDRRWHRLRTGEFYSGAHERSIPQEIDTDILRVSGRAVGRCGGQPVQQHTHYEAVDAECRLGGKALRL